MRKLLTSTLALLAAVCTTWAQSTSGTCGDNATWALSDDGYTLTISGSGDMYDYRSGNSDETSTMAPWAAYLTTITSVVIGDEITSISEYAFNLSGSSTTITTVTIGSSVKSIGESAFGTCASITSIEIPASVETISAKAFRYCYALETVSFADGSALTTIGSNAFFQCIALKNITIPDGVTTLGYAFWGCTSLESVTFGTGITNIADHMFHNCSSLTSVVLNGEVTSIGAYAFNGCTSLATFEIPSTVETIGDYAYQNCSALTALVIPESVTSIGAYAYTGCTALASITCENKETAPAIETSTFDSSHYTNITLDASDIYRTADNWSAFYVTPTIATENATITYGDDAVDFTTYVSDNTANAEITVTYTVDGETTEEQPTDAGTYTVAIAVVQDAKTNAVSGEVTLTINKAASTAASSQAESGYTTTEGTKVSDETITGDLEDVPEGADVTITYKYTDEDGNEIETDEQPTTPGEYTIVITIGETDNYDGTTIEVELTVAENSTGISAVSAEGTSVSVAGSAIVITTAEPLQARVYSIAGTQVASQVVDGQATIDTPAAGIYIVTLSDGTTAKVQVK